MTPENLLVVPGLRKRPLCPGCGSEFHKRTGPFGVYWGCLNRPECDRIAVFSRQEKLWRVSNQATRDARKRAHEEFDTLWRDGWMKRSQAYAWLSRTLNLDGAQCHIQNFTEFGCQRVVEIAQERMAELRAFGVVPLDSVKIVEEETIQ